MKQYFINVINLFLVCFIIEIIHTLVANIPNREANFTGINVWLFFVFFMIYHCLKFLKITAEKFFIYFFICFFPLSIINRYFTIFDLIEPSFYGFENVLYKSYITDKYDAKEFLFWQTGVSSNFNYLLNSNNKLISFFTIPPVALLECVIKAIFPNLYLVLLIQLLFVFMKKSIINWSKKK